MSSIKIPTYEDYLNYDGAHCHKLWKQLDDFWTCPACARSKYQIMRWTKRFINHYDGTKTSYFGWMAGLHGHHDHGTHKNGYTAPARFEATIICDQCNSSDGIAKRNLDLPKDFSFSPSEISAFVASRPHGRHKLDLNRARELYEHLQRVWTPWSQ
jgi:hypothetical protein